jgi:hypothetical protein
MVILLEALHKTICWVRTGCSLENGQYRDDQESSYEVLDSAVRDRKLGELLVVLVLMLSENVLARADLSPDMMVGGLVRRGEDLDQLSCFVGSSLQAAHACQDCACDLQCEVRKSEHD